MGIDVSLPSSAMDFTAHMVSMIDRPDQEPSTSTRISLPGNVANPSVGQDLSDNASGSSHVNLEVQEKGV